MKKIFLLLQFFILISCDFSEKKIYKNLYISNGGEFADYPVVSIKLKEGDQLNIFPFEVKGYKIESQYIMFKCIDNYGYDTFYFIEKNFNEYNYENKTSGPLNKEEFLLFKKKKKLNINW